ncbi:hypothetical protein LZP46_13670 [Acinetobacter sp. SCLZS86]|jgi:hypothetical protein|uniref:hypothetical protein n=1 Tax=Acinetobacter TaxID=469 RepID=UPI001F2BB4CD|nr:hypothetical protein [Acinetobacter sp. SCLZS86]UIZ57382.1 hypothetical protein LZP46_13670 [Acinetobacter sp. SCLZS86]
MGIDIHSLQLLQYNKQKNKKLGKTLTLGRYAVLVGSKLANKWVGTDQGAWCEDLLIQHFAAQQVDSIDNSDYEDASIIYDYNHPIPEELKNQYDTILDFGCSEHIFDVAQAFKNTINTCKIGGTILHILPADGFCGHGFYQFTPEFFFSLYSKENGFIDTEVFLSDLYDPQKWYKVNRPDNGQRINIRTKNETYVIVRTTRNADKPILLQQSDYTHIWNKSINKTAKPYRVGKITRMQEMLRFSPFLVKLFIRIISFITANGVKKLNHHKSLTKFSPPIV